MIRIRFKVSGRGAVRQIKNKLSSFPGYDLSPKNSWPEPAPWLQEMGEIAREEFTSSPIHPKPSRASSGTRPNVSFHESYGI